MTPTAQLSIGLNTSAAKASLLELKKFLGESVRNVAVSIDPTSIDRQIAGYFKQRTFKFRVDPNSFKDISGEIKDQISRGVADAFRTVDGRVRELRWNREQFYGSLKTAIDGQFGNRQRRLEFDRVTLVASIQDALKLAFATPQQVKVAADVTAMGTASPVATAQRQVEMATIASTIAAALTPAVDELGKAAAVVGGVVKQAGVGGQRGSRITASQTISAVDPETGFRTGYRRAVDDPQKALSDVQRMRDAAAEVRKQQEIDAAYAAKQAEQEKARRLAYSQAFVASEKQASESRKALDRQYTESLKEQIRARLEAMRVGSGQFQGYLAAEAEIQKRNRAEDSKRVRDLVNERALWLRQSKEQSAVEAAALKNREAAFTAMETRTRTKQVDPWEQMERERLASIAAFEAQHTAVVKREAKLRRQEQTEMGRSASRQIREQETENSRQVVEAHRNRFRAMRQAREAFNAAEKAAEDKRLMEISSFFKEQELLAARKYQGKGVQVAAALATRDKFGGADTSKFLGDRSYLLGYGGDLDTIYAKTESVTRGHVNWGAAVRELHSGARGLMGTLGAMWLTWGSIVPLLAGAAVGQAMRTVVTVGKELEYQLKFVQVLSNGAAVSMRDFTSAVAGSVVGPVEAANALRGLAQNGLDAKQAIMALPDVLRLATVGEMDLASAALGATGVMEAFNLRFYDLGRVGDVFAAAAASSNTSVESMVESMKQASTVADQYKLTIEEVAASLAVLAQRNITGSAAGTAFRNMMSDLAAPSEKAKRALAAVGVSIFDTNKQVKPFMTIMEEMKKALAGLNEQSRKEIIGAIFDERGQKAFENLVNNFDDLKLRIGDLQNSAGFMRQAVEALGDTTSGKISRLSASFQLVAAEVFNSSQGVKNLVDQMRLLVASEGFKSTLQGIADVALVVTRFLTENITVLAVTGAAWLAFKVAVGAGTAAVAAIPFAAKVASGALNVLGISANFAKASLGFLAGGLGLVAILGLEFLALSRGTDEAREATLAYQNQSKLMQDEVRRASDEIRKKNEAVREEIRLLEEGVTAAEAKRRAEQKAEMNPLKQREAQLVGESSKLSATISSAAAGDPVAVAKAQKRKLQVDQELAALRQQMMVMEVGSYLNAKDEEQFRKDSDARAIREQAAEINQKIRESKVKVPLIDMLGLRGLSNKEASAIVAKTREEFNKAARTVTVNPGDTGLARAMINDALGDVREMKSEFDERARLAEQLREAQIGSVNMGPVLTAELAVQRARERSIETVRVYSEMLDRLNAAKGAAKDDASRVRIDGDIDRLQQQQARELFKLDRETEIAQAKRDTALRERGGATQKDLAGINATVDEQIRKRREKSELKVVDAVEAARAEASAAAMAEYARKIAEQEALISAQKQAAQFLKDKELDSANQQISVEEEILAIYREQARVAGKKAGDSAAQVQAESMTAEYGMKRFWTEYQNQAESTADQVYSVMKFSMDGMNRLFADFRTTGKMSFKDFATSVIMEITRIMTSRAIFDFTSFLMRTLMGGGGVPLPPAVGLDGAGLLGGTFSFANGGVMTSSGPIPLRRFANGGVGYGPMAAIHSEWTKPEAYVPLPDGRTIPVTVSSQQQAAPVQLSYSPVINIDSRTDREDVFRGVDERIRAGNEAMIQHLRDTRVIA